MAQIMNGHSSDGVTLNQVLPANYAHFHYPHQYVPPIELVDYNQYQNGFSNDHQEKHIDGHITVVQVEQQHKQQCQSHGTHSDSGSELSYKELDPSDFITVLKIASTGATVMTNSTINSLCSMPSSGGTSGSNSSTGSSQKIFVDSRRGEIEEEVIIYRLPGERLGMALRFDGGQSATECIRRVFVQNISPNSPSSKAIGLMLGMLREGDEIMQIDSRVSSSLTRLECITLLRDAPVCIRLLVRRCLSPLPPTSNTQHYCSQAYSSVPNQSQSCLAVCYCQNELSSGQSLHPTVIKSESSQLNYSLPSTNMSMSSHLLQSGQNEQLAPKKVPPPVPPRMATTTLSKRRPRPVPSPLQEELGLVGETLTSETKAASVQLEGANETQAVPVEKPPRRKNQNSGNPPPLPPRRPKGPPPKPPVDREASSVAVSHVSITSTSITTAVTRTLPSLVTVITTSKVSDVTTATTKSNLMSTSAVSNQTLLPSKSTHSTSMTSKMTFTISNSKVSSFIRQTAEKLHRKLSGKTNNQDEENDAKHLNKSPSKISKFQIPEIYRPVLPSTTSTITTEPKPSNVDVVPPPVHYVDACQESEDNLCFESDTDDTGSSVSTIIERNPSSNSNRTESMLPSLEQSPYFNKSMLPESSDASIVDRVLSPIEHLESELDSDTNLTGPLSLSAITRHMSSMPFEQMTSESAYHSLSIVPNLVASVADLLLPNKTQVLIADLQPTSNAQQVSQVELSRSITKMDTDSQQDQLALDTIDANSWLACDGETDDDKDELIVPPPMFANTEDKLSCESSLKTESQNRESNNGSNVNDELEEDEEDLAAIKNDIISRVDDDKDDFMLDNDYLNETSAHFMFHHSGSELILGSYSELSSITEEDEEDSEIIEFKTEVQSDSVGVHQESNQACCADVGAEVTSAIGQRRVVSNESIDSGLDHELCKLDLESDDAKPRSDSDLSEVKSESDTSTTSKKVRLDNVFDFLNKATDDFEFVERMLELTNDKIDSIDDIMRIRESLRGLQESEQRDNLQRFLDGKDVLDELMALSSHSHSSTSSEGHESPGALDSGEEAVNELVPTRYTPPPSSIRTNEFTSLPVTLVKSSHCFKEHKSENTSKIPTLLPISNQADTNTLRKRSQSVSNIFNRSGGFNSLIEFRPSLIPRPISNFNLELPPPPTNYKPEGEATPRVTSHNCLNRSTSMQSIFSTNSLSRSVPKNKVATRRLSVANGASQGSINYHQNCLRAEHQTQGPYYGSLSRSISKSSQSVYSTGSLPRPAKNQVQRNHGSVPPLTTSHHYGNHFRTTSLTDLTYGFIAPKQQLPLPNRSKHATLSQSNLASGAVSRRHSSSSNLLLCTDPLTNTHSRDEEVCGAIVEHNECHSNRFGAASLESAHHKRLSSKLRTSTSLSSLVRSVQSTSGNHFWHCSHHNPTGKVQSKRVVSTSTLPKTRPIQGVSALLNGKTSKQTFRKNIKPVSSNSSTSSSSSNRSDSEESVPQTRSILRQSSTSTSTNKFNGENSQNFDYWNQNIPRRKKIDYEINLYSDSESSDITISSGDSAEDLQPKFRKDKSEWQPKRRQHHKVCFVDEIIEHRLHGTAVDMSAVESVMVAAPGKPMGEEHFYSSSPEVPPTLSSSTSTSSISSLGSSGELSKPSNVVAAAQQPHAQESEKQHNGGKAFYLSNGSHREDSGIFASDDTSTSEFSQSPSPELIIGSTGNLGKSPDNQSASVETSPSIKERIAFFDAPTNKQSMELNRSQSCTKHNGNAVSLSNHLLSRSSSAPYDCHSKIELINLSSSKVETTIKSNVPVVKNEITVYPVNLDLKKPNAFLMRDSFITARRHQNVCKLKGLIIPESLTNTVEETSNKEIQHAPEIDLPTIISEDILKIQGVEDEKCVEHFDVAGVGQASPSIEIISLEKATNPTLPKYSPMFKRRPFSLLPTTYDTKLNQEVDVGEKCHHNEDKTGKLTKQAPTVPPKPKVNSIKLTNEASNSPVVEEAKLQEQLSPPPLPPKMKEINLNILNVEEHVSEETERNESSGEKLSGLENNANQSTLVCSQNQVTAVARGGEMGSTQHNEFVIYQKQYSMRAIIFEWDPAESVVTLDGSGDINHCASLGITLTGGLHSHNEVIVADIAENLLADRDGRLQRGDRIISINGKRLKCLTQKEIMEQLNAACATRKVVLVCCRPHDQSTSDSDRQITPLPVSYQPTASTPSGDTTPLNSGNSKTIKADITKDVTGLGFIIEGGKNSSFGDRPITIKRIFRGGPVDKEGSLVEGDELLLVNDHPIHEMTRAEAWNFLKQLPDGKVSLVARRRRYF